MFGQCRLLRGKCRDLGGDLVDPAAQLGDLAGQRVAAGGEKRILPAQQIGEFDVLGGRLHQRGGKAHAFGAIALGLQPGAANPQFEQPRGGDGPVTGQLAGFQPQDHITGGNTRTLFDMDRGDHPTFGMLDGLAVARHLDPARGDDCA